MPLMPKFLQRRGSQRGSKLKKQVPIAAYPPLSPVSETVSITASDAARPVPPPQHFHSHVDGFEHPDALHDDYRDEPRGLHSRLHEGFTRSDDVPLVVREPDGIHHGPSGSYVDEPLQHSPRHPIDYADGPRSEFVDELGYGRTEQSERERAIPIAPSDLSASSGSQKVTFIGVPRSGVPASHTSHRKPMSTLSRSMTAHDRPRAAYTSSSLRDDRYRPRRQVSDPVYQRSPRVARPEGYHEQKLPYMIFVDWGDGLEIGNEVDGFMPYQDWIATAHLRRSPEKIYYIIPGSTPVIFNDEEGRELYKVDAWKYNTPTLRRRRYIIQDDRGNVLFNVGGPSSPEYPRGPKIMYLNSETGSMDHHHHHYEYDNIRPSRRHYTSTPLTRSALFNDEERTESSVSSAPDIVVVNEDGERVYDTRELDLGVQSRSPLARSHRPTELSYTNSPDLAVVDEYGHPVDDDPQYQHEYPWGTGTSSTESEGSYAGSRRRSRVHHA